MSSSSAWPREVSGRTKIASTGHVLGVVRTARSLPARDGELVAAREPVGLRDLVGDLAHLRDPASARASSSTSCGLRRRGPADEDDERADAARRDRGEEDVDDREAEAVRGLARPRRRRLATRLDELRRRGVAGLGAGEVTSSAMPPPGSGRSRGICSFALVEELDELVAEELAPLDERVGDLLDRRPCCATIRS